MAFKWGGQIKVDDEGKAHVTIWRNEGDGDKGSRLSWDIEPGSEKGHNAHFTNQNNNAHSQYTPGGRPPK
jgi:hypothetical protein